MSQLKKIKFIAMSIIFFFTTILSGCAFKDIDKRTFVVGIGIDPAEESSNKYKVTLKIALPIGSIKQASGPSYAYMSHESDTISAAIRIIETHTDKVIDFGHTKFIAISENLLKEDLETFMDYFLRRGDIQLVAWVAAARPSAEHILKTEPTTESAASVALFNFFDGNGTDSPFIITTYLYEFRRAVLGKGLDSVLPLVESNKDGTELIINKSVVVQEKKDPLELTSNQTQYFNSLIKNASGYSYKVSNDDLTLLLDIINFKVKFKIIEGKGRPPRVDMKVTVVATVLESSKRLSGSKIDEYNKLASNDMKHTTMDLLTFFQEKEVDPFGFGLRYRATRLNDKNTYDKWKGMYPDLEFDVKYHVEIKSLGAIE